MRIRGRKGNDDRLRFIIINNAYWGLFFRSHRAAHCEKSKNLPAVLRRHVRNDGFCTGGKKYSLDYTLRQLQQSNIVGISSTSQI